MNMNPMQMLLNNSLSAQNSFAETQLRRLHTQTLPFGNMPSAASSNKATNANATTPATASTAQTGPAPAPEANTINIRLLLDHATTSNIANMRVQSPRPRRVQSPQTSRPTPTTSRATATATTPVGGPVRRPETTLRRTRSREYLNAGFFSDANTNTNTSTVASFSMRDAANSSLRELKDDDDDDDDDKEKDERDFIVQKHGGRPHLRANGIHRVMTMANQPLTASMLAALVER
jgi:hypothetical protein